MSSDKAWQEFSELEALANLFESLIHHAASEPSSLSNPKSSFRPSIAASHTLANSAEDATAVFIISLTESRRPQPPL
jgi:hypothetical protein